MPEPMTATPALAVVMAVKNGAECVAKAVESVLSQSFGDYEFVVVNDGSMDDTAAILDRYAAADRRMRVIHQANQGLGPSLNTAIRTTTAPFIARQDADDESLPGRFEAQVRFMQANPAVIVCGTWAEFVHEPWGYPFAFMPPTAPADVRAWLERGDRPIVHGSVVMRRSALEAEANFYRFRGCSQDLDLWLRLVAFGDFAVIPALLYRYTVSSSSASARQSFRQAAAGRLAEKLHAERRTAGKELTDWRAEESRYLSITPPDQATSPEVHGEYILAARLLQAGQYSLAARHFRNYLAHTSGRSLKAVVLRTMLPLLPLLRIILAAKERILVGRPYVLRYINQSGRPEPEARNQPQRW
jgi:glycosyltransferase involved in cell wall biosynthesis